MRARSATARARAAVAVCCVVAGVVPVGSLQGATAAPVGTGAVKLPPGQARKAAGGAVEQAATPAPSAVSPSVARTGTRAAGRAERSAGRAVGRAQRAAGRAVGRAVQGPPPHAARPPKPKRPPQAKGPKAPPSATPPQAAPSQSAPSAPTAPVSATQPGDSSGAPKRRATSRRSAGSRRAGARRHRSSTRERSRTAATPAPLAAGIAGVAAAQPATRAPGADSAPPAARRNPPPAAPDAASPVVRTVQDIVEVVPRSLQLALAALAGLSLLLGAGYLASAQRARRLARQRGELLRDVGLLQSALLPPVPDKLGALRTSVAYRPAEGLAAGGDFYDAVQLPDGRAGFVLGDVSGHGRDAIERTAFLRYTLRAYLEAGLEPRTALQVAGRAIGGDLGDDFATVLLAVHDPRDGSLTYASAGHPAPIVVGNGERFEPVDAGASPPVGIDAPTGLRQTTVPLAPGAVACLFTDGLVEARAGDGLLGRERLQELLAELGPDATAQRLLARLAEAARVDSDDMAVCLLTPTAGVTAGGFRREQLELSADECDGPLPERFLAGCGVDGGARRDALRETQEVAARHGGAVLSVVFGSRRAVEVLPRNVESIEAAARRTAATA